MANELGGGYVMDSEKTVMSEHELVEAYEDMLDEVYGLVEVAGMSYDTSVLLKNADPIAYHVGMSDYADVLMSDDENLEIEGWM
jgi:hypothetical protein